MTQKIKTLSFSERFLQKSMHYSLDNDTRPKLFLIPFFITEKCNYFYANYIR